MKIKWKENCEDLLTYEGKENKRKLKLSLEEAERERIGDF